MALGEMAPGQDMSPVILGQVLPGGSGEGVLVTYCCGVKQLFLAGQHCLSGEHAGLHSAQHSVTGGEEP